MKKILIYYSFIIVTLMVVVGFVTATNYIQLATAVVFFPLFAYFAVRVFPQRSRAINLPKEAVAIVEPIGAKTPEKLDKETIKLKKEGVDVDRRMFLKLIGSAGLSLFFFSMFTKRAEAAFFGSVPGPGTVSIKDTAGNKIDPSEKQPTDGYRINQVDETSDPPYSYYGFSNKTGAWFIMRETTSGVDEGQYRYRKGSSDFPTGWSNRTTSPGTYDYFDNIF